jgi:hypothetical protein
MDVITSSALYTVTLRTLVENGFDLGLADTDYPLEFEAHRDDLNKRIINRYYFDEIGLETEEYFKKRLNDTMFEIMPYYNQLYKSELQVLNPNLQFERNTTQQNDGTGGSTEVGTDTRVGTNKSLTVGSTTPTDILATADIEDDVYADNANKQEGSDTQDDSTSRTGTNTSANTLVITDSGRNISESELLTQYRETFLNIDVMIIDRLGKLFMGVM